MTGDAQDYNIGTLRKLLEAAFTAEELRTFCYDRPAFRPVVNQFGRGHGLADMVQEVIVFCEKRLLFDELLAEVRQWNPGQYKRFGADLGPAAAGEDSGPHTTPEDRTGARLTGQQRKDFSLVLGDAYDPGSFDAMLDYELDKSLHDLAPVSTDFPTMLRLVIRKAQQEGWLPDLVQAAGRGNPGNARLQAFVRQFFEATSLGSAAGDSPGTGEADSAGP